MIIALPPELETLVNRQVESGRFENAILQGKALPTMQFLLE